MPKYIPGKEKKQWKLPFCIHIHMFACPICSLLIFRGDQWSISYSCFCSQRIIDSEKKIVEHHKQKRKHVKSALSGFFDWHQKVWFFLKWRSTISCTISLGIVTDWNIPLANCFLCRGPCYSLTNAIYKKIITRGWVLGMSIKTKALLWGATWAFSNIAIYV